MYMYIYYISEREHDQQYVLYYVNSAYVRKSWMSRVKHPMLRLGHVGTT